ncbi:pilus assembly protein N-terminal domain-containing protein [Ponticaulis sp.]|uniref:pilus assembly protein N-terminal domain-containing protein n=1 Tax=Ponticaulis sp. TaxID=2020902 RepID=UPI00260D14FC|nr:pilus assembly protein N-terminal domain-containing protein [Ponticaulis sp.]MDF1679785.1 pilus assembly protein N-terminal domain-containing protein [Ponticaulis sp.]
MKHILMTVLLSVAAPLAIAGEGGPVQQVIEAPRQEVGPVIVQLEESIPLIMSDNIAGISIGTSRIADVIVHDQNTLFVTGKAYGSTSLHVIDTLGNVVVDTTIHVVDASPTRLRVNRAGSDYSMDCTPNCQASPNIGDNADYYQSIISQARDAGQ